MWSNEKALEESAKIGEALGRYEAESMHRWCGSRSDAGGVDDRILFQFYIGSFWHILERSVGKTKQNLYLYTDVSIKDPKFCEPHPKVAGWIEAVLSNARESYKKRWEEFDAKK